MRIGTLLVWLALALAANTAAAAELVMFRRAGCPWCAAFDRTIAPIYDRAEVAAAAPIRMVDLDSAEPPAGLARAVRYTPTFVLMIEGREAGRIEGYPGEDFFWARLEKLVREAVGSTSAAPPAKAAAAPL
jgi:thioredoxin-related protein